MGRVRSGRRRGRGAVLARRGSLVLDLARAILGLVRRCIRDTRIVMGLELLGLRRR